MCIVFRTIFNFSLVTVTDAGVVVVDPINKEASTWLKDNLSSISDKPVTHLIYSHSHLDHASGGAVYADAGARVIAHGNAPEAIDGVAIDERFDDTRKHADWWQNLRTDLAWRRPWQGSHRGGGEAGKCSVHHRCGLAKKDCPFAIWAAPISTAGSIRSKRSRHWILTFLPLPTVEFELSPTLLMRVSIWKNCVSGFWPVSRRVSRSTNWPRQSRWKSTRTGSNMAVGVN